MMTNVKMKWLVGLLVISAIVAGFLPAYIHPVGADPPDPTLTIYTSASDGYQWEGSDNYTTVWTDTNGTPSDTENKITIGQDLCSPNYHINRGFVYFDTSEIPAGATINSAQLYLWGISYAVDTDFLITVQTDNTTVHPLDPMQAQDYNKSLYSGDGGSFNTTGFVVDGWNALTLNADGRSWINVTGITKFALRSNRDIAGTSPTGPGDSNESVQVGSFETGGTYYAPRLVIQFTGGAAIVVPTMTTDPVASYTGTTAMLTGAITSSGGEDSTVTVYWGTADGGTNPLNWANSSAPELPDQPQGVSSFLKNITGLSLGTTYYYNAKAANSSGTTWGTTQNFTTMTYPTITLSAATNISMLSATINGNITNTGGDNPNVVVYWGTTDGGTNPGAWDASAVPSSPAQPQGVATFDYNIIGWIVPSGTTAYFSASATNSAGTSWPASSSSYTTSSMVLRIGSSPSDGDIVGYDADYNTTWVATSGGGVEDTGIPSNIGQTIAGDYDIWRSFLIFNTSYIPAGSTINSVTLYLFPATDVSSTDFLITVQNGQPIYPHDPLVVGDYDKSLYFGNGGNLDTSGLSGVDYNAITFNATGRGWIQTGAGAETKLCLRSDRDIVGTVPVGDEYVEFYASENGPITEPYLWVEFTPPAPPLPPVAPVYYMASVLPYVFVAIFIIMGIAAMNSGMGVAGVIMIAIGVLIAIGGAGIIQGILSGLMHP